MNIFYTVRHCLCGTVIEEELHEATPKRKDKVFNKLDDAINFTRNNYGKNYIIVLNKEVREYERR